MTFSFKLDGQLSIAILNSNDFIFKTLVMSSALHCCLINSIVKTYG